VALKQLVIYNHGKDSLPWSEKTGVFADVARSLGFDFITPDYRDQPDPDQRLVQLLAMDFSGYERITLVGSSMGGYVATLAAESIPADGLFLLAPAFYLPGYRRTQFKPVANTWVFHGWQDDIVPPENAWRFCQHYNTRLFMMNSDHRLIDQLPELAEHFSRFLRLSQ
jgi:pimeloyl-ACP methyl ester carboxylesterase